MITQEQLKKLFHYDEDTGIFTRLVTTSSNAKIGQVVGYLRANGYITISVNSKGYQAHRLGWLYIHGTLPKEHIDHINGIRSDNRLGNLREATNSQNLMNRGAACTNTSGFKGVSWHKRGKRWQAHCKAGGARHYLGLFDTAAEASLAYQSFASANHKEFYNGGFHEC